MTKVRQFYGVGGVPMTVPASPDDISTAWLSHRARVREWLGGRSEEGWSAPTRCAGWTVADLVQHLASGSQFVGYTLHEARRGAPTQLLQGFDAQQTAAVAAQMFAGRSHRMLLDAMEEMDASAATEIAAYTPDTWTAVAEAPPGHVPAYVSLNHFLFDSWVHERDLMLPAGDLPVLDPTEASAVVTYVLALAGVASSIDDGARQEMSMVVQIADLDREIYVGSGERGVTVSFTSPPNVERRMSATADVLVDIATGREPRGEISGDPAGVAYLRRLATIMA